MKEYIERLLVQAEREYGYALEEEERTEEAMDSMERKYWEGQVDVLKMILNKEAE